MPLLGWDLVRCLLLLLLLLQFPWKYLKAPAAYPNPLPKGEGTVLRGQDSSFLRPRPTPLASLDRRVHHMVGGYRLLLAGEGPRSRFSGGSAEWDPAAVRSHKARSGHEGRLELGAWTSGSTSQFCRQAALWF